MVSVSTGEELQQAFRDHARHIVINDHLDLTNLPLFSASSITTTAVGVIASGTDSVRVCPSTSISASVSTPPSQFLPCACVRSAQDTLHSSSVLSMNSCQDA